MQTTQPNIQRRRLSSADVRQVAPALEAYTQQRLYGEVWKRPGLAPRDRSLVTIAALIGRNQTPALTYYINQALENGVKPPPAGFWAAGQDLPWHGNARTLGITRGPGAVGFDALAASNVNTSTACAMVF